jgi:hypothetical protein
MYIHPLFLLAFHLVLVAIVAFTDEVLPLLTPHLAQPRGEILLLLDRVVRSFEIIPYP